MIKVIEVNLSIDGEEKIKDHQARVIEVDGWYEFVDEIKNCKTISRNSIMGSLYGCCIPKYAKVENLTYDDFHLMCDVINAFGIKSKKLVYKV